MCDKYHADIGKVKMSLNPNFFTGTVEGHSFIAAQAIGGDAQSKAGVAVDILTSLNGTRIPEFDENGWLFRPIADPELLPHRIVETLESTGTVHEVGTVRREQIAPYVGFSVVDKALSEDKV